MQADSHKEELIFRLSSRPEVTAPSTAPETTLDIFMKRIDEAKMALARELYDITITANPTNRPETNDRLLKYEYTR